MKLTLITTLFFAQAPAAPADAQKQAQEQAKEQAASTDEAEVEDVKEMDVDPKIFDDALEDYYAKSYADAATGFWGYLRTANQADDKYEWSQFFLAESLRELGLTHGAVQYYYLVAKTRSRPEILPLALERLEALSRTRPFDDTLLYEDLLYDSEFGFLPENLSNWVQYVQGYYDYKNDFVDWGNRHFDQIKVTSPYYLKALFVKGVYALKRKKDDEALALFDAVVHADVDKDGTDRFAQETKNNAHLAMARLLFDLGDYKRALEEYESVKQIDLSFNQAQLLLEKAWTNYHLGQHRKAMGLLHALRAPSYARFFLPDAFILRGIIFKQLCHFIPAKRSVREFRSTFGRPLQDLRRRVPLQNIRVVSRGATQEGAIARRTELLRVLEAERELIDNHDSAWEDVQLDSALRRLYDLEIREQARLWKIEFEKSADASALALLESDEQMNLLDYEVGLDIFKRLKADEAKVGKELSLVVPYDSADVYYEFDTEFWNDELHSYQFFINSRCFEGQGQQMEASK
jgi:hypothetical protein